MQQKPFLRSLLIGLVMLIFLNLMLPIQPASAVEPTPVPPPIAPKPPDQPPEPNCRLHHKDPTEADCALIDPELGRPAAPTVENSLYQPYPVMNAREVPPYSWVSIIFKQDIDPATIHIDSFYLTQEDAPINGAVTYIKAGKLAVFRPEVPLQPNTIYTAHVTRAVRDISGLPIDGEVIWHFTTAAGSSPFGGLRLIPGPDRAEMSPSPGMNIYFGDLHSHSSYSDGWGSPAEAYFTARARGLHFFALTEHGFMLTDPEWQGLLTEATAATVDGQFIGLRGFEYTHLYGHLNVFDTDSFVHRDDPNYDTLEEFYAWLVADPTAVAQFNHPLINQWHNWNFENFSYDPAVDQKIVLRELSDPSQFFLSLDTGWRLGSVGNSDAHQADWGLRRMGLVAPSLTRADILSALRARRTFFASPNNLGLAVVMQANGHWMGSSVPDTSHLNLHITVFDPAPQGQPLILNVYDNGFLAASTFLPGSSVYNWSPTIPAQLGHYYYVEAYYGHWLYPAYSSPIWVERPPIAAAGESIAVAPGAAFTLDGGGSWDPDGDALAYHWQQEGGPAGSPSEAAGIQPTFNAASDPGEMTFRLTVVDPGGLSDSDVMTANVTNQPILSISKSGPALAGAGNLITYILTITNSGATAATDVTVTDAIPAGATYVSGGTLQPGNIVSWTIPNLAANGGVAQVSFAVSASTPVVNKDYQASCAICIPGVGRVAVLTNGLDLYFPILRNK